MERVGLRQWRQLVQQHRELWKAMVAGCQLQNFYEDFLKSFVESATAPCSAPATAATLHHAADDVMVALLGFFSITTRLDAHQSARRDVCPVQRFTAMSLLCSWMLLVEIASVFCCRLRQALGPYLLRIKVIGALLSLCLWLAMEHHRLCFSSPATSQHRHAQLRSMPQAQLHTSDNKFFIMDHNKYLLFVFYNRNCISYSYF